MTPEPELHRPTATDRISPAGMKIEVVADRDEMSAIAGRLVVPEVRGFTARFALSRPLAGNTAKREGEIIAEGWLRAVLLRECVISMELFEEIVEQPFRVRFVPAGTEADDPDPEADDEIGYEGAAIDLGEAAVEQLALIMDPYPRKPGAVLPPEASDPEEGPFAALRGMSRREGRGRDENDG